MGGPPFRDDGIIIYVFLIFFNDNSMQARFHVKRASAGGRPADVPKDKVYWFWQYFSSAVLISIRWAKYAPAARIAANAAKYTYWDAPPESSR